MRHNIGSKVVALMLITAAHTAFAQGQSGRQVEQLVRSNANPAADIQIDPAFSFLGHTTSVVMDGKATAEQFWFVKVDSGRITRAAVVHFERWNEPGGKFDYPRLRMTRLGRHEYLHQSFPFEAGCELAGDEVRSLIDRAGLKMARECIATRFVRAASADQRNEIILFYVEPVSALPSTEGLGDGGLPVGYNLSHPPSSPWATTDQRLTDEALKAIHVRDHD